MERHTDIFSERDFQRWLTLFLEAERERFRQQASAESEPEHPARFYETSGNREKETQHEDER